VITNEGQWESSALQLFLLDIFTPNRPRLPWLAFANALQRHFLRATRQDPAQPERYLSKRDLEYFRTRYFPGPDVGTEELSRFWSWFGKVLQEIRYKRPLFRLYAAGLIYGTMGKDEVQHTLQGHPTGAALLRWSESSPGQVALAYVGAGGDLKHYLVEAADLGPKKLLADFLLEKEQFQFIMQCAGFQDGAPVFRLVSKPEALKGHVSAAALAPPRGRPDGYDPLEAPWAAVSAALPPAKRQKTRTGAVKRPLE